MSIKGKEDFTLYQKIMAGACSGAIGAAIANRTVMLFVVLERWRPIWSDLI